MMYQEARLITTIELACLPIRVGKVIRLTRDGGDIISIRLSSIARVIHKEVGTKYANVSFVADNDVFSLKASNDAAGDFINEVGALLTKWVEED